MRVSTLFVVAISSLAHLSSALPSSGTDVTESDVSHFTDCIQGNDETCRILFKTDSENLKSHTGSFDALKKCVLEHNKSACSEFKEKLTTPHINFINKVSKLLEGAKKKKVNIIQSIKENIKKKLSASASKTPSSSVHHRRGNDSNPIDTIVKNAHCDNPFVKVLGAVREIIFLPLELPLSLLLLISVIFQNVNGTIFLYGILGFLNGPCIFTQSS